MEVRGEVLDRLWDVGEGKRDNKIRKSPLRQWPLRRAGVALPGVRVGVRALVTMGEKTSRTARAPT